MRIEIIRKMDYRGYKIYVFQFGWTFQYIFSSLNGQNLFQDRIQVRPTFLNYIKHKLHLIPVPYSKDDMDEAEKVVLSGAMKTIDALIEKDGKQKDDIKEIAKEANATGRKGKDACIWRAITADNGELAFQCVRHDILVEAVAGEKPYHYSTDKAKPILSPIQLNK